MPGMSGIELAEKLRAGDIDTVVVFLSGYAEFGYAQRALKAGAVDYLLKPFNPEDMPLFLDRLRQRIERKRRVDSLIRSDGVLNPRIQDGDHGGRKVLKAVVEYLDAHYASGLTLATVAANCGTNGTSVERLFKKYLDTTFIKHLTALRIGKACELLCTTGESIEEICFRTGYEDYFYFNKVFKKEMGITPYRYRKNLAKNREG
jgi:YesN/AraC family two-component response regulator